MKILLVEDESEIRKLMKFNLELDGHLVDEAIDGREAMQNSTEYSYDVIVLDLMLPLLMGLKFVKKIRDVDQHTKIIIVSARDGVQDRILGLKLCRWLSDKTLWFKEFFTRVNNLGKRLGEKPIKLREFEFGANTTNWPIFCYYGQRTNKPTPREAELLKCFIENKNKVITRKQILQDVWGYDVYPSTRTIDNFILSFRKYFEQNAKDSFTLHHPWCRLQIHSLKILIKLF